ncbi:hypothetical protein HK096_008885, partial [Nowakowskiella sp. JEL0078]
MKIAAILGASAVAAQAYGAHGLPNSLKGIEDVTRRVHNWKTAADLHLIHSVAILSLATIQTTRALPVYLWLAGIVGFS